MTPSPRFLRLPAMMLVLLGAAMLASCLRNEFTIEFRLPADANRNYRIEYYAAASSGGKYVEGAVSVVNGKGSIRGVTRMPTIVYIYESGDWPVLAIYAERGQTITLEGTSANPATWSVGGNKINKEVDQWRHEHQAALTSGQPDSVNRAVAQFVEAHPDSPTATFLMLTYFNQRDNASLYSRLWRHISPKAKTPELLRAAASPDQLTPEAIPPTPRIRSVVLYARADSTFQLTAADARVSILHFRRSIDAFDERASDSIAALAARFAAPRLQAADITFETDAAVAQRHVASDSLKRVMHASLFAGEASETAINLGVRRTPWFIVLDSTGRAAYAGGDLEPAIAAARKIASQKPQSAPTPKAPANAH